MPYRTVYVEPSSCSYQEGVGTVCAGGGLIIPEDLTWFDYGGLTGTKTTYGSNADGGFEVYTVAAPGPEQPWWYSSPGWYAYADATPDTCNYQEGVGNVCGGGLPAGYRLRATAALLASLTGQFQWLTPDGYWMHPAAMYGYIGSSDFPGNATATRANVAKILEPFGEAAMEAADRAAWTLYMQQVAINGAAGWTPANANPAAIMDYVVMTALTETFPDDPRARAILAYLDTAEWQAKVAAGWDQAAAYGRMHAAANESNSVFQGFLGAFSKFMMVAGPLMLVTGAFSAVLAAIKHGVEAGAAVGLPELTTLDMLKAGYQTANAASGGGDFGLPVSPSTILGTAGSAAGAIGTLTSAGVEAGVLAAPALDLPAVPSEIATMPMGQDYDYSSDFASDSYADYMGMDTGNLGLDVPQIDVDPFAGTPFVGDVPIDPALTPGLEPAGVWVAGTGEVEGFVDADGNVYDANGVPLTATDQGYVYAGAEPEFGNVMSMGVDDPQSLATGTASADQAMQQVDQTAPAATQAAQAATASGFSLDSIIKLMNAGMSIYSAIQKLAVDRDRAQRGLPPTGTSSTAQRRTVRDPRTGQMVQQQLDPRTGQWITVGLAPAGAMATTGAPGSGLSAPVAGVPMWVWLAGGGLALFALAGRGERRPIRYVRR